MFFSLSNLSERVASLPEAESSCDCAKFGKKIAIKRTALKQICPMLQAPPGDASILMIGITSVVKRSASNSKMSRIRNGSGVFCENKKGHVRKVSRYPVMVR